jgi:hypothetical protein
MRVGMSVMSRDIDDWERTGCGAFDEDSDDMVESIEMVRCDVVGPSCRALDDGAGDISGDVDSACDERRRRRLFSRAAGNWCSAGAGAARDGVVFVVVD